jgi:hypothetical protein
MLVVLSDLHFSEAQSTKIGDLRFNKNLPVETYQAYFSELNQIAVSNQIPKLDLVLAGDILELSRSAFWFESGERPYQDNEAIEPGSLTEATILKIIDAIPGKKKWLKRWPCSGRLKAYLRLTSNCTISWATTTA